jgi:AcrR family transcriptional regulator/predicted ester cyclase
VTEDFVDHGAPPWAPQGRAGYLQIMGFLKNVLRIRYEVHEVVADGDLVAARATVHGVHDTGHLGFPATGKPYAMPTMHMYRASGGLLAEHWGVRDELSVLWQVGACRRPSRWHCRGVQEPASAPARNTARAEQVRATRQKVLTAARDLFLRRGYSGSTIEAVAKRAAVSPQTVYNVVGGKAALLKAVYDVAVAGDDEPVPMGRAAGLRRDGGRGGRPVVPRRLRPPGTADARPGGTGDRGGRRGGHRARPGPAGVRRHHRGRAAAGHGGHGAPRRRPLRAAPRPVRGGGGRRAVDADRPRGGRPVRPAAGLEPGPLRAVAGRAMADALVGPGAPEPPTGR